MNYLFLSEFQEFLAFKTVSNKVNPPTNDKLNALGFGFTDDINLAARLTLLQAHELNLNFDNFVLMLPPEFSNKASLAS